MSALPNFQELARQEALEFQLEQKLERFEQETSNRILQNVQSSIDFMRLVGDISNLYFPVLLDTILGRQSWSSDEKEDSDEYSLEDPALRKRNTPDQGGTEDDESGPPTDGPSKN